VVSLETASSSDVTSSLTEDIRRQIMKQAHSHPWSGHCGARRTMKKLVHLNNVWPSMKSDVENFVRSCDLCQRVKINRNTPRSSGQLPQQHVPFKRLGVDVVGPLPVTKEGFRYFLFVICHASRWIEAVPLKVADTNNVLNAFYDNWLVRYGVPSEIVSDNAGVFDGAQANEFWLQKKIEKIVTSPYHQASNGLTERNIATLIEHIRLNMGTNEAAWHDHLPTSVASMRNKKCSETQLTPYQYIFGTDMPGPGCIDSSKSRIEIAKRLLTYLEDPPTDPENRSSIPIFQKGDLVLVKNSNSKNKFDHQWIGPFEIKEEISTHLFELETEDGKTLRRHTDLMKKYHRSDEGSTTEKKKSKREKEYEVEMIKDSKINEEGERVYLVHWKGYDATDDSWEPISSFKKLYLIRKFHKEKKISL